MQTIEGFEFFPLEFDRRGRLTSPAERDRLTTRAAAATDVIYLAHGFRNDASEAHTLYAKFLQTFRAHLQSAAFAPLAARRYVVVGIFWPSKPFREAYGDDEAGTRRLEHPDDVQQRLAARLEQMKRDDATPTQRAKLDKAIALLPKLDGSLKAQDEFVTLVMSLVATKGDDDGDGARAVRTRKGSETLARLSDAPPVAAHGSRAIGDVVGSIAGGVGRFLNLTTWYVMKERSGTVGASGVARAVRELAAAHPHLRTHLVGHSLGGRLMAGCAKALADDPPFHPDSLYLLEAAFSHYGFSADNGKGTRGFFRAVVESGVVKGPFLSTFSAQDTVVGKAYSIMSRLALDSSREIGDEHDEFGGIGRNGPLRTTEVHTQTMRHAGSPYDFKPRLINNLDGSNGFVKDHGDVTNPEITYAFASALMLT